MVPLRMCIPMTPMGLWPIIMTNVKKWYNNWDNKFSILKALLIKKWIVKKMRKFLMLWTVLFNHSSRHTKYMRIKSWTFVKKYKIWGILGKIKLSIYNSRTLRDRRFYNKLLSSWRKNNKLLASLRKKLWINPKFLEES